MSTIVEGTIPTSDLALADALDSHPNAAVRVIPAVAHGEGTAFPLVWVTGADCDRLHTAMAEDPTTESVDVVADLDTESLFRVDWSSRVRAFVATVREANGHILDASAQGERWRVQLLFPEHDQVAETEAVCANVGMRLVVDRIDRLSDTVGYGRLGLTEEQFETVACAHEAGYYEVPRSANQSDLAADLDVSHQALSERLRRAHETVISNAIAHSVQSGDRVGAPRLAGALDH